MIVYCNEINAVITDINIHKKLWNSGITYNFQRDSFLSASSIYYIHCNLCTSAFLFVFLLRQTTF